jgi:hypothetical protein
MAWLAVLGTLLGTLVGAIATLAAQQLAARDAAKREQLQRRAAMRLERKSAIDAFLEAAQAVERIAGDRDKFDFANTTLVSHNLWVEHKRLALICSAELSEPLDVLANTLHQSLWDGPPNGVPVWKYVADATWRFREAARREIEWTEQE